MLKIRRIIGPVSAVGAVAGMLPACATEVETVESVDSPEITSAQAGTGLLKLNGFNVSYASTSGGDEFIRSGEKLKAELLYEDVQYLFSETERMGLTPATLEVVAIASFLDASWTTRSEVELPLSWGTAGGGLRVGTSTETIVPARTPALRVDFRVKSPTVTFKVSDRLRVPAKVFPVFGAFLPNKLVLFDNDASGGARTRVVEFGTLVQGAGVMLSYADWRADRTVDKIRLDTTIGQRMSGSRFGPVVMDAKGEIEYEIGVAYSADGTSWTGAMLERHGYAAVLQTQPDTRRASYETQLRLPSGSRELRAAFNVKAFLKVPDFRPGEIINPRYRSGERILIAERWDNNGGGDYRLPVR